MYYNDQSGEDHRVEAVACPKCSGVILVHSDLEYDDGPEPGTASRTRSPRPTGGWPPGHRAVARRVSQATSGMSISGRSRRE